MNPYGYPPAVWRLFRDTPRAGRFGDDEADVLSGEARTPAAVAVLRLQLRLRNGQVDDARFQAYGCPTTIAVGAWLAQWALNRSAGALSQLSADEIREALEIPEERAHCALLGEDAIKELVRKLA